MPRLKTVIHAHTDYSADSNVPPGELVATARRQGVDCLAVTDHDTIDGALAVRRAAGLRPRVIVGEEISTADGHLIGLFLKRGIRPGLSAEQTIRRIREQGGLVLAPHPFSSLCDNSLHGALGRLAGLLDAVEVHNAQNPLWWEDLRAERFARRRGLAGYAGADAHLRGYLAAAFQVLPVFDGSESFLAALRRGRLRRGRFGPGYVLAMAGQGLWQAAAGRRRDGFGDHAPGGAAAGFSKLWRVVARGVRLG